MGNKHYNRFEITVGGTFGHLNILNDTGGRCVGGKVIWKCQCKCGRVVLKSSERIQRLKEPSCGCIKSSGHRIKLGKRYGLLTIVGKTEERSFRNIVYQCRCDCGTVLSRPLHKLRRSETPSCGCLRYPLNKGISDMTTFKKYKRSANNRKFDFEIEFEEFSTLISKNCHYCGQEPQPFIWSIRGTTRVGSRNGLDRVNSALGYTSENVVTCCKYCNRAKSDMSSDDFKKWVHTTYHHLFC